MTAISPSPFDRLPKRRRRSPFGFVLGSIVLVVIVALVVTFRTQAAGVFWDAVAPLVRLRGSFGAQEVERLRGEVATLTARMADRDALYAENVDLKARLNRSDAAAPRTIAAVLQRPPFVPYDTLLVDAGTRQGVAVGDIVLAGGGAVVGLVAEAYAGTARVELLSAPGKSYQAMLRGEVPVAVEGQGGGSLRAELPAGTTVAVGDTVTFPALMPRVVADVDAIEAHEGESFIVVYMALPANPASLRFVEIVKP